MGLVANFPITTFGGHREYGETETCPGTNVPQVVMRRLALCLLLLSLLLGAGRLFTGVVYGIDLPVAYLVLKHAPDATMERAEANGRPVAAETVLDAEEPRLSYGWLYLGLMRTAPVLVAVMLAASVVLLAQASRRRP